MVYTSVPKSIGYWLKFSARLQQEINLRESRLNQLLEAEHSTTIASVRWAQQQLELDRRQLLALQDELVQLYLLSLGINHQISTIAANQSGMTLLEHRIKCYKSIVEIYDSTIKRTAQTSSDDEVLLTEKLVQYQQELEREYITSEREKLLKDEPIKLALLSENETTLMTHKVKELQDYITAFEQELDYLKQTVTISVQLPEESLALVQLLGLTVVPDSSIAD